MELLLQLLGSIALLLWGLRMVRTGVMRAYGTQLKQLAQKAEGRILPSFLSGLFIAALLQSSTATALIAATFSGQGVISVGAAFITILGADVGTAVAVVLASQKFTTLAPLLLFVGIFGFLSFSRSKPKNIFRAIAGLGMILLALSMISGTAKHLATFPDFITVIKVLETQPAFLLFFALALTYLAHSSLAVVLLSIGFLTAGLVGVEGALVLVLGANLGSGLLPVISNMSARRNAKIPVIANLLMRGAAVLVVLPFVGVLVSYSAELINLKLLPLLVSYDINPANLISTKFSPAAFHLGLNLFVGICGVIFAKPLLAIVEGVVPENTVEEDDSKPKHLDFDNMSSPTVCLACAKRETLNMAYMVQNMLSSSLSVLRDNDSEQLKAIVRMNDSVNGLYVDIKLYIARVLQSELSSEESQKALDLLNFTTNMEHVGDIVESGLMSLAQEKIKDQIQFSEDGLAEISAMHEIVTSNFELAINTYISEDTDLAHQLYESKADVRELESRSVETHLHRLGRGVPESLVTSSLHVDMLRDLKRINSHVAAVAYPILVASGKVHKTRWKKQRAKSSGKVVVSNA